MSLDKLLSDIEKLFIDSVDIPDELCDKFGQRMATMIRERVAEDRSNDPPKLRLSQVGKPLRQQWYAQRAETQEKFPMSTRIKFLYGDMVEELFLFLAEAAGHSISDEQKEVELNGVKGHIDGRIDGVLMDIKTASRYGFKKFEDGSILNGNDPFGYIGQISAYVKAEGDEEAALIAINKESGEIVVVPVSDIDMIDAPKRVDDIKEAVNSDEKPDRCYEDKPDGASGNRTLCTDCGWCSFKFDCWSDANDGQGLRVFKYANGPKYLTLVAKTPNVQEITPT